MINYISPYPTGNYMIDKINKLYNNKSYKSFLDDKLLDLSIYETENNYIINGFFPNFNNYDIKINYTFNFLNIIFYNKDLYKEQKNTIDIEDYGTFRRMFYLNNINYTNIKLDFDKSNLQLIIEKI